MRGLSLGGLLGEVRGFHHLPRPPAYTSLSLSLLHLLVGGSVCMGFSPALPCRVGLLQKFGDANTTRHDGEAGRQAKIWIQRAFDGELEEANPALLCFEVGAFFFLASLGFGFRFSFTLWPGCLFGFHSSNHPPLVFSLFLFSSHAYILH